MSYKMPIGPIHPMLKEPINLTFYLEGELIIDAEPNIGFAHRGIEKIAENKTWFQNLYLLEKVCGICSASHQGCYAQGAERVFDVEAPERALYIRTLMWELERLHSHLLWIGVVAHLLGFDTLFMYTWKDREKVLDVVEAISGRRVGYSINTVGGVRKDLDDSLLNMVRKMSKYLRDRVKYYEKLLTTEKTILLRTQNLGILRPADAIRLGTVGPTVRGSGLKRDIRGDYPYTVYKESPFETVTFDSCDVFARVVVRVREMYVSLDIIDWILEEIPSGKVDLGISPFKKPPVNEATSRIEAPRGELYYYLKSDGKLTPYRIKIRTPTLANIISVIEMVKGHYIADIPPIVGSIDPCMSCMDRVLLVDTRKNEERVMTENELIRYSIKWYKKNWNWVKEERE